MAITPIELYDSGPINGDAFGEVRVKEYLVSSTSTLREHEVMEQTGFHIGDLWTAPDSISSISLSLSSNAPAGQKGQPLTLRSYRVEKITAVTNNFNYRLTLQYSTEIDAWSPKRSVDIASRTITIFHDLDFLTGSIGTPVPGCASYQTITSTSVHPPPQSPPAPLETWEPAFRINRLDGVDVLRPRQTVNYTLLMVRPNWDLIARDAFSTNAFSLEPFFSEQDAWLFAGVGAEEIARHVYRCEFKFAHDPDYHRHVEYEVEPGTDTPKISVSGIPRCRSSRVYPRSLWPWLGSLNLASIPA